MIAVTFALPAESSAFMRRLENRTRAGAIIHGQLATDKSEIGNQKSEIVIVHTGVGARECEKRLRDFLQFERPSILISSGFCGGTNDDLMPGDLVLGENFSDGRLSARAKEMVSQAHSGKLFSADRVVDPAHDRYAIGREHGAIATDMETGTIARLCAECAIPMLSLRVVSDSPAAPFPAPPQVLFDVEAQRTRFGALLAHLARDPAASVRLANFSKQVSLAKTKLAQALCSLIAVL